VFLRRKLLVLSADGRRGAGDAGMLHWKQLGFLGGESFCTYY
jgi:hypothetical protein